MKNGRQPGHGVAHGGMAHGGMAHGGMAMGDVAAVDPAPAALATTVQGVAQGTSAACPGPASPVDPANCPDTGGACHTMMCAAPVLAPAETIASISPLRADAPPSAPLLAPRTRTPLPELPPPRA